MRKFRCPALLLSLLPVLLCLQFLSIGNVRADDFVPFPNVKYEGDTVTWDPIEDPDEQPFLAFYKEDAVNPFLKMGLYKNTSEINLKSSLRSMPSLKSGVYRFEITASDMSGNLYRFEGEYEYFLHKLESVKNIKIDGDYLTWDFDDPDADLEGLYFSIWVNYHDSHNIPPLSIAPVREKRLPVKDFILSDTHSYSITIYVDSTECITSDPAYTEITDYSNPKYQGITGLTSKNGIISWNEYDGAESYMVRYIYSKSSSMSYYRERTVSENSFNILNDLAVNSEIESEQQLFVIVQPLDENKKPIDAYASVFYDYDPDNIEEYPLMVAGKHLTSNDDLGNILADYCKGKIIYDPFDNSLEINTTIDIKLKDYNGFPLFASDSDLKIYGRGWIDYPGTVFSIPARLEFCDGANITCRTNDISIFAEDIILDECRIKASAKNNSAIEATSSITFMNDCISVSASTESPEHAAITAKKINNDQMVVKTPQEGHIDNLNGKILDAEDVEAKTVSLVNKSSLPPPTPTPTPTTAATATKAVPSPTNRVVPSVTSAPNPTVAGKVTSTPVPTSEVTAVPTSKVTAAPTSKVEVTPISPATATATPEAEVRVDIYAFVERIYKYVLDRVPEEEGALFWTEELYSFRRTGAEVGLGFIFSDEFVNRNLSDADYVTVLYRTFFGREPEEGGFKFWTSALADGSLDRMGVANGFVYSQEWADTCASYGIRSGGSISPSIEIEPSDATYAFVERMYTTAMNRASDEEGKKFWANELSNFRFTGEQVGVMFFLSDEMNSFDLSDSEFVARLYKTFMDREPEEGGFKFWVGYLADGGSREGCVLGFTRSEEFVNKCIEARILPY